MVTPDSYQRQLRDLIATQSFAEDLARAISSPITIALNGTLGAGKTQMARYFCEAMGVPADAVTSPTYVLLQRYRGQRFEIYHFDFYRLENALQVWDLGFDELQESQAILLVEWADKFPECLPSNRLEVLLSVDSKTSIADQSILAKPAPKPVTGQAETSQPNVEHSRVELANMPRIVQVTGYGTVGKQILERLFK